MTDAGNTTMSGTLTVTGVTTHTGAVKLSLTGSNKVLTGGGTNYSASTVQSAFPLPFTPVFRGKNHSTNNCLSTHRRSIVIHDNNFRRSTVRCCSTQVLNFAFTQIVTAISTTSTVYNFQTVSFVRTYGSRSGGELFT